MTLLEFGTIPHLQSIGFFCEDPKISYKYKGDTVESHVLVLVTLIFPYLTVRHSKKILTRIKIRYDKLLKTNKFTHRQ